jgi:hypothetical protein
VRTDERAFYHQLLLNMDVEESKVREREKKKRETDKNKRERDKKRERQEERETRSREGVFVCGKEKGRESETRRGREMRQQKITECVITITFLSCSW